MSTPLPAWRALLHGNAIRGYLVVAANASAAREAIEKQMREEGCHSLLLAWKQNRAFVEPVTDGDVPGGMK